MMSIAMRHGISRRRARASIVARSVSAVGNQTFADLRLYLVDSSSGRCLPTIDSYLAIRPETCQSETGQACSFPGYSSSPHQWPPQPQTRSLAIVLLNGGSVPRLAVPQSSAAYTEK